MLHSGMIDWDFSWIPTSREHPEPYQAVRVRLKNGLLRQGFWTGGFVWIIGHVAIIDAHVVSWTPIEENK